MFDWIVSHLISDFFSFINKKFSLPYVSTIGIPCYIKTWKLSNNSIFNVKINDTSGQKRFRNINEGYYKRADICILIYDITNQNSFKECEEYFIPKILENCQKNIHVLLMGNKSDCIEKRKISKEEGIKLAFSNFFYFIETTCTQIEKVAECFSQMITIYDEINQKREYINLEGNTNNKKNCC